MHTAQQGSASGSQIHESRRNCPFDNLPEPKTARGGEALTAEAMKNYRWVRPELVAEVKFSDWKAADHLRHSRFLGLRDG
jgi:ATP-dependent DNA ligase